MDDINKIKSLLHTGDLTNLRLGLTLAKNLGWYEQITKEYVKLFQAVVPFIKGIRLNQDPRTLSPEEQIHTLSKIDGLTLTDSWPASINEHLLLQIARIEQVHISCELNERIASFLYRLSDLEQISFIGRQVDRLPEAIGQLGQLRLIALSATSVSHFPSSFADLKIQELWMINCKLDHCFLEICDLQNLTLLTLRQNQLKQLPDHFAKLHKLEILDLARNRLTDIPSVLWQLPNLKQLNLEENNLSQEQIDAFKAMHPDCEVFFEW
ncbi:MAG: leucine-rich repeat domain-containing protein [Bacteroidota bacterium]